MKITKKTGIIAIVLVAAIALMGFGFALWSSELKASGVVNADASWDVRFTSDCGVSVVASAGCYVGSDSSTTSAVAEISSDGLTCTFPAVNLTVPSTWANYTIYVKNNGSVPAKLKNITWDFADLEALGFRHTEPTAPVAETDVIAPKGTCQFNFTVELDPNLDANEVSVAGEDFSITLNYEPDYNIASKPSASHVSH